MGLYNLSNKSCSHTMRGIRNIDNNSVRFSRDNKIYIHAYESLDINIPNRIFGIGKITIIRCWRDIRYQNSQICTLDSFISFAEDHDFVIETHVVH